MHYFDTSFVAPLILSEATSESVAGFIDFLPTEELAISHWTKVEFSSLLAREVRMGGMEAAVAREADTRFEALVEGSFAVLLPDADDFNLAREYLGYFETGLRAGDALHLAISRNHGATAFYSLDLKLIEAGRRLGIASSSGIPWPVLHE